MKIIGCSVINKKNNKSWTKKEKEILNNYNKLFKIDESRNNLNIGRVVEPKPNLDYYDNLNTMEDNYDNN